MEAVLALRQRYCLSELQHNVFLYIGIGKIFIGLGLIW